MWTLVAPSIRTSSEDGKTVFRFPALEDRGAGEEWFSQNRLLAFWKGKRLCSVGFFDSFGAIAALTFATSVGRVIASAVAARTSHPFRGFDIANLVLFNG